MKEKITILFPVYKEKIEIIDLALNSILNQTFKDFILRIRLDAPDNLEAQEYFIKKMNDDSRIEFEVNEENVGLAKTLNRMMCNIETKYIARMDADDIAFENRLEEQYKFMEANKNIDLCGTNIIYINSYGEQLKYNERIPTLHKYISIYLKYNNCMAHPTYFMKKEVIDNIKYRNDLRYAQDYEFMCRCVEAGYNIANLDKYLLYYRTCEVSASKLLRQNLIAYYVKYYYRRKKISSNPPIAEKVEKYILNSDEAILLDSVSIKKSVYNLFKSNKPIKKRILSCLPRRYRIDLLYGKVILVYIKKIMK